MEVKKNAIATLYCENYLPLAEIVNPNKERYCDKYGYDYLKKTSDFSLLGFDKIHFLRENIENYNWIWWQDSDSLITNFNIPIEAIIDSDCDMIISKDIHGINAGSFLIRNSINGIYILDLILSKKDQYKADPWQEQRVIIDNLSHLTRIKLVEQNKINSYLYPHYGYPSNTPGNWSSEDVLLHLPGMDLPTRLHYANYIKCNLN